MPWKAAGFSLRASRRSRRSVARLISLIASWVSWWRWLKSLARLWLRRPPGRACKTSSARLWAARRLMTTSPRASTRSSARCIWAAVGVGGGLGGFGMCGTFARPQAAGAWLGGWGLGVRWVPARAHEARIFALAFESGERSGGASLDCAHIGEARARSAASDSERLGFSHSAAE